jgi:hypothetical protein
MALDMPEHVRIHAQGYNKDWAGWLTNNAGAAESSVRDFAKSMAQKYGFNW